MALSGLLRTAQFGDIDLFDRILEEHIGGTDNPRSMCRRGVRR